MRRAGFLLLIFIISIVMASAEIYSATGFPTNTGAGINSNLIVADIDGDGKKEIVAAPDNRMIYAFEPDGSLLFNYTAGALLSDIGREPAATDLEGDGKLELVVYGNPGIHYSYIHYVDSTGRLIREVLVGMNMFLSSPAVTKDKIILVGVSPGNPAPPSGATGVYAFDTSGKALWYLDIGWVSRYSTVALGDIDGDGLDEAGVVIDNGISDLRIAILKIERTGGKVLWEKNVGSRVSGITIEDINNDGRKDIIIGSGNGIFVWDGTGSLIWSNNIPSTTHSIPAVGDIDGDGTRDIIIGSDQQRNVYAISNGTIMPGFPVSTIQSVWSRPALGDLDGDGKMDIAAGDYGGYVYAWDSTGRTLTGFPFIPAFDSFMSGGQIDDIDGDGIAELIMGNNNGNLYVWTTKLKDITPPVTTDNIDALWHNNNVFVHLAASDDISGVAGTYYTLDGSLPSMNSSVGSYIPVIAEGVNTIKYFSIDNAGNMEQVRSSLVKIDLTAPGIYIASPVSRNYLHSDIITLNFSSIDGSSGISSFTAVINGTQVMNGQEFDMLNLTPGKYEFTSQASDIAGNTASIKVSFNVISNIDSLIALNDRAIKNGWITSEKTASSLSGKLTRAKQLIATGEKVKANNILKAYMNEIDIQTGKTITPEGARILTTEAAYVYISNY